MLCRMHRHFGRRHGKDQPSVAGVDALKAKRVAKKRTIRFCVLAVNNDMSSRDQAILPSFCSRTQNTT